MLLLVGEKLDARERRVMAECRSDEVLRVPVEVDRLVRMITRSVRADRPLE